MSREVFENAIKEIEAICQKNQLGGIVILGSRDGTGCRTITPEWSVARSLQNRPGIIFEVSPEKTDQVADTIMFYRGVCEKITDACEYYKTIVDAISESLGIPIQVKGKPSLHVVPPTDPKPAS